jgi:hypothetical protein
MSKFKLTKPLPDVFKIQVSPEQSEALQLELFNIGKRWLIKGQKIQYPNSRYLFLHRDNCITYTNVESEFDQKSHPEIQFFDYFTEMKTGVELNDYTYWLDFNTLKPGENINLERYHYNDNWQVKRFGWFIRFITYEQFNIIKNNSIYHGSNATWDRTMFNITIKESLFDAINNKP